MALVMVVGLCYSAAASLAINRSRIVFFSRPPPGFELLQMQALV